MSWDWEKIRGEWEAGDPLREIAERHDLPVIVLSKWSRHWGWVVPAQRRAPTIPSHPMCSKCVETKPLDKFIIDHPRANSRRPWASVRECKDCKLNAKRLREGVRYPTTQEEARAKKIASVTFRAIHSAWYAAWVACQDDRPDLGFTNRPGPLLLEAREMVEREGISEVAAVARLKYQRDPMYRQRQRDKSTIRKITNPEEAARYGDRRKVRAAQQSDGTLTGQAVRSLFGQAYGKPCPYCGKAIDKTNPPALDHLDPLSRDGLHSITNVAVVCRVCNKKKLAKPFDVWLRYIDPSRRETVSQLYYTAKAMNARAA
jgi:5-methylcytosine-specific restriction endonuclease McrA